MHYLVLFKNCITFAGLFLVLPLHIMQYPKIVFEIFCILYYVKETIQDFIIRSLFYEKF